MKRAWRDNHYSNHRVSAVIEEYVHNARDREILRAKLVDDITYDALAEKYGLTYEGIRDIVRKGKRIVEQYY